MFNRAVPLKENQPYSIHISFLGGNSYYGNTGKKNVTGEDGTEFEFINLDGSDTNTEGGQFPELYYIN